MLVQSTLQLRSISDGQWHNITTNSWALEQIEIFQNGFQFGPLLISNKILRRSVIKFNISAPVLSKISENCVLLKRMIVDSVITGTLCPTIKNFFVFFLDFFVAVHILVWKDN
jgi:hypothetical protein